MSLRRMQWKSAREGSVPMLIHLGKYHLGQTDKVSTEHRFGLALSHEQALAELDGPVDLTDAKVALLRGLPMITVEFVEAPAVAEGLCPAPRD